MIINIKNKSETEAFGLKLGSLCFEGMCITLNGDLGAGKTTLTKSIGKGLGVSKTISSPTFTILKIYQGIFRNFVYLVNQFLLSTQQQIFEMFQFFSYKHTPHLIHS